MFAFLTVEVNSKEMLMSGFLLRLFKANYLENLRGYPSFSLCIPIALVKIYFFRVVLSFQIKIDCTGPLYYTGCS